MLSLIKQSLQAAYRLVTQLPRQQELLWEDCFVTEQAELKGAPSLQDMALLRVLTRPGNVSRELVAFADLLPTGVPSAALVARLTPDAAGRMLAVQPQALSLLAPSPPVGFTASLQLAFANQYRLLRLQAALYRVNYEMQGLGTTDAHGIAEHCMACVNRLHDQFSAWGVWQHKALTARREYDDAQFARLASGDLGTDWASIAEFSQAARR